MTVARSGELAVQWESNADGWRRSPVLLAEGRRVDADGRRVGGESTHPGVYGDRRLPDRLAEKQSHFPRSACSDFLADSGLRHTGRYQKNPLGFFSG